jgi:hypothetical protein
MAHLLWLLRARDNRPRDDCAAERRYKFPPSNVDRQLNRPQWDHARCIWGTIACLKMEVCALVPRAKRPAVFLRRKRSLMAHVAGFLRCTYLLPPPWSGGALLVQPRLRFHIPLIEPGYADPSHFRAYRGCRLSRSHSRRGAFRKGRECRAGKEPDLHLEPSILGCPPSSRRHGRALPTMLFR